jgi:hypothetical protein
MNFALPSTGMEQPPAFATEAACRIWLTAVPMDNIAQAQAMFLRQLTLLSRFTLPKAERLAVLEALRDPLRRAQEAAAKKFVARPLPLAPPEQAALDSTLAIWQALLTNYLHCFEEANKDSQPQKKAATIAQRALATLADWQVDLVRSERLPDAGYWQKLNRIFAAAEAAGFAVQQVNDPLRHGKVPVSPLSAYAECQLLHAASPYELPARDLLWVARWARRWGTKIGLLHEPPQDIRQCAHPLWVDLDSDQPAGYLPKPAAHGRWLETTALRTSLANRIALLAQGQSPAELQLGSDVVQPMAEQLLARLLQRWCQGGVKRRHERSSASGACRLIAGFDAVHFHLSGQRVFKQGTDSSLRREREKFEACGNYSHHPDRMTVGANAPLAENAGIVEEWRLLDTSASGLRISRPIKEGARMGAGVLVAIEPDEGGGFTLGCVRWALRQDANLLTVGIQLFPGATQAIAVRPIGFGRAVFHPAFLIAANEAAQEPASIVLPLGSYQPGRQIEILPQAAGLATLTHLLGYGSEFERYAYTYGP